MVTNERRFIQFHHISGVKFLMLVSKKLLNLVVFTDEKDKLSFEENSVIAFSSYIERNRASLLLSVIIIFFGASFANIPSSSSTYYMKTN